MIAISVTSTVINFSQFSAANGTAPTSASGSASATHAADPDGDGDGGRVHHGGGGHLMRALQQAFQSLGLSAPGANAGTNASTATSSSNNDSQGSDTGTGISLETALRNFVHALFNAVHGENSGATPATPATPTTPAVPATPPAGSSGPGGQFSAGLSALITQVSNGNAPSGLQDAFNALLGDLQSTSGASPTVTLQQFLTALQQNLGYGNSTTGTTPTLGSSVSAVA
jgi:hypothetical protein